MGSPRWARFAIRARRTPTVLAAGAAGYTIEPLNIATMPVDERKPTTSQPKLGPLNGHERRRGLFYNSQVNIGLSRPFDHWEGQMATGEFLQGKPVLLGEAPREETGWAFDPASFTTKEIAAAVGLAEEELYKAFWLINVFDLPREPSERGYFDFPVKDAVAAIDRIYFRAMQVICVGSRVAGAMERAFGLDSGIILENRWVTVSPRLRTGTWTLARIPHPSGRRNESDSEGRVLSRATRRFLKEAAFGRK